MTVSSWTTSSISKGYDVSLRPEWYQEKYWDFSTTPATFLKEKYLTENKGGNHEDSNGKDADSGYGSCKR